MSAARRRSRTTLFAAAAALLLLACTSTDATPTPEATATASLSPTPASPPSAPPAIGSATPTPTPTPLPIELIDGWPSGAIGPLVLYEHNVEGTAEVVVFDLGTGRSLHAVRFPDRQPGDIALGGSNLFENRHDSVWIYELDGTARELFRPPPGSYIERLVPSPDGSLVALNQGAPSTSNLIEVIDVERGEVILTASQEAATAAGFIGVAGPDYWSQDQQRIALVGYTYSESHGGRGSLSLDGTIELTEPRGAPFLGIDPIGIDPLGERPTVVYEDQSFICAFGGYGGARRLVLVDPETGSELNSAEARWHSLSTGVWSPDGTEYRYTHRDLPDEVGEAIEAAPEGPCAGYELLTRAQSAPRTWNLLSIDGSPPVVYDTLLEIQQRWYGDRTVTFVCGDEVTPGTSLDGWSIPRFERQDCYRDQIEIRVGDQPIGSARYPLLLGFIDPPSAVVAPQDTAWRVALAGSPTLVDLVSAVLSGPEAVVDLATTIDAYCSFHGELFDLCEARGLTAFDYFEAIVVTDLLHCEGCGVPPENIAATLARLYRTGGVSSEQFWHGVDASADPVASDLGVDLVAAWALDDPTRDLIGERWQESLSATHVLAFRSTRPDASDAAITGFLLFVDPSAPAPVAIIEPTSESWTAVDTAMQLGRGSWQPLYLRE